MKLIVLTSLFLSSFALAAKLECTTSLNLDEVASAVVVTAGKTLVKIDDGAEAVSYVSEPSPGVFSIEAYLIAQDMRIYSKGKLGDKLEDQLTLSTWTRDNMLDVSCKLLK